MSPWCHGRFRDTSSPLVPAELYENLPRQCVCEPEVNNVKLHIDLRSRSPQVTAERVLSKSHPTKYAACFLPAAQCGNFYVVRSRVSSLVITLFRGFINVTGITGFNWILNTLDEINSVFDLGLKREDVRIDSSCATGKITGCRCIPYPEQDYLDLEELQRYMDRQAEGTLSLRPTVFPGGVIRRHREPTIILFSSGHYNIVGGKNLESIRESHNFLKTSVIAQRQWSRSRLG